MTGSRVGVLETPPPPAADWAAHVGLGRALADLARIEADRAAGRTAPLEAAIEALAAIIDLVDADEPSRTGNAARPLKELQAALHDFKQGASPPLLTKRAQDRPTDTVSDGLRGNIAAAVHLMIQSGIPRNQAGKIAATKIEKARLRISGLKRPLDKNAVLRWRYKASAGSDAERSVAFTSGYADILNVANERYGDARNWKREVAEAVLDAVIEAARQYGQSG